MAEVELLGGALVKSENKSLFQALALVCCIVGYGMTEGCIGENVLSIGEVVLCEVGGVPFIDGQVGCADG